MSADNKTLIPILSLRGRVSRLQFWTYTMAYAAIFMFVTNILAPSIGSDAGELLLIAMLLIAATTQISLTVRRCHDFGRTGWLSILLVVPAAFFVFLALPGNPDRNAYGEPSAPPSIGLRILAFVLPIIAIGIPSWIATSAYNETATRLRATQAEQLQQRHDR